MKHIFILNGNIKSHPFEVIIHKVMKDYDYQIIYTKQKGDAIDISKQFSNQKNRIYSVGGDGMLNEVVQGLVHTDNELVVIPLGTGNDFHRYLSSEKDCQKILIDSLKLPSVLVDTALLNQRYYINTACFGLDSVIANKINEALHIPFASHNKSYIRSIIKQLFQYRSRHIKITDNNQVLYDGDIILCTVNNGQYYGGGFCLTPKADIRDGYLDLCVVDKLPGYKIPYMLTLLLLNKLEKRKEVHYFRCQQLSIDCPYSGNIDGEEINNSLYEIKIVPRSIRLVCSL